MFTIDKEQQAKLDAWMKRMQKKTRAHGGAIGGRFVYQFCPTSIGVVVTVRDDITKEEIDLSDYENW